MRTKVKHILSVLILAVILITAIPSVKDRIIDLTDYSRKTATTDYTSQYDVNIHFMSTGTSDCIILDLDGEYVLMDGGYYGLYEDIDIYLRQIGAERLSAVINSHPDADHIGCIPKILENYPVDMFCHSEASLSSSSALNEETLKIARANDITTKVLKENDSFTINRFLFEVVAPYADADESNSMSLVIKVSENDFSLLLTGDSDKEVLQDAYDRGHDLSCDILKVPHHGSITSTTAELLDLFDPEYSVITVGDNSYGLPDPEVLKLFEEMKIPLLRTDTSGTIIISSNCDGEYYVSSVQSGGLK